MFYRSGSRLYFALLIGILLPEKVNSVETTDPLRLDPLIRPITQNVELNLDPNKARYSGKVRAEVYFHVPTNRFRFHASALDLGKATLNGGILKLSTSEGEITEAVLEQPVRVGRHTFEAEFTNDFSTDGTGLFKIEKDGKSYLFTQMEPNYARRTFPCWDEPSFKIPWNIVISAPANIEVVSNMPVADAATDGQTRRIEFGRTPPMPSYLVAICAGPLESIVVDGQAVPGRFYTTAAQTKLAQLAMKEVPQLFNRLEEYFGSPYPYPKLDHIAIAGISFGAMENVGAITYSDALFLTDESNTSAETHKFITMVIGHEIAHMWFGNLVTMQWWDDVWLNEAFAEWMSMKIAQQVRPEFRYDIESYKGVAYVKRVDAQPSVKAIRRSFRGGDNLLEAFDALSYIKGQAILRMVEGWMGEEDFRRSLQGYFAKHRWSNARAEDLWTALSANGNSSVAELVRKFIEQPGLPSVTFRRGSNDMLEIRQQRYRTISGEKSSNRVWDVPITIRFGAGKDVRTFRTLLATDSAEVNVPGLSEATWIHPNAAESGYYTWNLPPSMAAGLTNLPPDTLSVIEQLGLLDSTDLAFTGGEISAEDALGLLLGFSSSKEAEVQKAVVAGLVKFHEEILSWENRPASARLISRVLRPVLDSVGTNPQSGEPPAVESLRASLLLALGMHGADPDLIEFCKRKAHEQLTAPRSVEASIADATLRVATWHGDAEWAKKLRVAFESQTAPDLRNRFLSVLSGFANRELATLAYEYALGEQVRPAEFVSALMGQRDQAPVRFEWLASNYFKVKSKVPEDMLPMLPAMFIGADTTLFAKIDTFFQDPSRKTPLTEGELTKLRESVELESALRKHNLENVRKLLASRR